MRSKKAELKLELFGLDDWERLLSDSMLYQNGIMRIDAKAAFFKARMQVADEIVHRQKDSSISLTDFYEALARLGDCAVSGGGVVPTSQLKGSCAENLEAIMKKLLAGLAVFWGGELRCFCQGHAWDQKKFADLSKYLPQDDPTFGLISGEGEEGDGGLSPSRRKTAHNHKETEEIDQEPEVASMISSQINYVDQMKK